MIPEPYTSLYVDRVTGEQLFAKSLGSGRYKVKHSVTGEEMQINRPKLVKQYRCLKKFTKRVQLKGLGRNARKGAGSL